MPKRSNGFLGICIAALLLMMLFFSTWFDWGRQSQTIRYSDILSYFQQDRVREFVLDLGSGELVINRLAGHEGSITYKVPDIGIFYNNIRDYVLEYNQQNPNNKIDFDFKPAQSMPQWVMMLPTLLLVAIMVALWVSMMRQSRGGGGGVAGFGKAKARPVSDGRKVTFADVAGADEEKEELVEVVEFLRSPGKFNTLGARIPKGCLLVGPPGTGKTLLARAVAGEAEVQFFSISGSDFVEMFVGVGASRVRDLFDQAKKHAPSVIFIDEIDAVGRQRGAGLGGGHDEREQTLNQLLVEMDGFSANTGVIVLAATNRRDILDPALLRPGRFDRQIVVGYPDIKGREEILKVHARNKPIGPDVSLNTIAKTTAGFTGADLENLMNESALLAARRNLKAITMKEIEEATIKVAMGPEKRSHVITDKDKRLTAYHEAGHAICTYYSPTVDPVHQVSIIPRGSAGGYTMSLPSEDRNYVTKTNMSETIVVLMGGRVAEQLILDDISTGASSDLVRATKTARKMVTRYGFSDRIGPIVYGQDQGEVFLGRDYTSGRDFSENVAAEIDAEIRNIVDSAYLKSTEILKDHMEQLHLIAKHLLEHEKIDGDEFRRLMEGKDKDEERPQSEATSDDEAPKAEKQQPEAEAQSEDQPPDAPRLDISIGDDTV